MDKDERADNRQSVTLTDEMQENFSYQSPVTLSSPAPGPDDRKAAAVTTGADSNYQSTVGPIFPEIDIDEIRDSRPNWLPVWSPEELSQMQKDDGSIRPILESKLKC